MTIHLIYLHGFASSPQARKAQIMVDRFRGLANFIAPDLNVPDFEHLTLSAQIDTIAQTLTALSEGRVYPIGSSLGGLALVHCLRLHPEALNRVSGMILMAPALEFYARHSAQLGDVGRAKWQQAGSVPVEHYAYGKTLPLHYGFLEDMAQYNEDGLIIDKPTLIFHGLNDESVPYGASERYTARQKDCKLHLLDSDHGLIDQMEHINAEIAPFIGLR